MSVARAAAVARGVRRSVRVPSRTDLLIEAARLAMKIVARNLPLTAPREDSAPTSALAKQLLQRPNSSERVKPIPTVGFRGQQLREHSASSLLTQQNTKSRSWLTTADG